MTSRIITDQQKFFLHCSLINGIGPATVFEVLSHVLKKPDHEFCDWPDLVASLRNHDITNLYSLTINDLLHADVSHHHAIKMVSGLKDKSALDALVNTMQSYCNLVTIIDHEYPAILRNIHQPPLVLYYRGDITLLHKRCIALVGSRLANAYAAQVIADFVPELVRAGWCIVSGGARGVDTMTHETTRRHQGKTIVVLGSGLLQPYPPSNEKLFESLIHEGNLVVSPFAPETPPDKRTFPARNRIISGLSEGSVIIQAARKSGALITAHHALEQGRFVFAVPGSVYDELSLGCHDLLKEGAIVVNGPQDVLREFGQTEKPHIQQKISLSAQPEHVEKPKTGLLYHLAKPATFDELLEKTGLEYTLLHEQLFILQLEGKIRQHFSGTWESL